MATSGVCRPTRTLVLRLAEGVAEGEQAHGLGARVRARVEATIRLRLPQQIGKLDLQTVGALGERLGGEFGPGHHQHRARGPQELFAPATLTVLNGRFPEELVRTRALAVWTAVGVAGGAAGNLIGGALTEYLS